MSRIAPIKTRLIEASLLKKGFTKDSTHHEMLWLEVREKRTSIRTRISHGEDEYDASLLKQMEKQLKLSGRRDFFLGLVKCPVSGQDYLGELRQRGELHI